jgi:hypothetical protein
MYLSYDLQRFCWILDLVSVAVLEILWKTRKLLEEEEEEEEEELLHAMDP